MKCASSPQKKDANVKPHSEQIPVHALIRSPLLARNTLLNLLGYGTPAIAALFAIPMIIAHMGTDRFGILSLAWVLIGYLSLLDLGFGRALTKIVAEKLGDGSTEEIPSMIWTALSVMVLISIVMSLVLVMLSGWIVTDGLQIPSFLIEEAQSTFLIMALIVPLVILSVGFRGILEAYQRFDMVNAVRIPLGLFSVAAPLAVIPFTLELPAVLLALWVMRLLATAVQFYFCYRIVPGLLSGFAVRPEIFLRLLRFGSWMTITNIINPLLLFADRFIIGAVLSVAAVAFYATPGELIIHLVLISTALMSVMFPAFSTSFHTNRPRSALLLDRSIKYIYIVIFPIVFLIVCFASEGLRIWLNEEFAANSFRVCQMLSVGIFFTCLGQMPYALIQGAGRPDLSGKLHLCQLPIYFILLVGAIRWWGINGAALIWALRAFVDAVCMYALAQKLLGADKLRTLPKMAWLFAALILLAVFAMIAPINLRIGGSLLVLCLFAWLGVRYLLSGEEIDFIKKIHRAGP
jgi:O-antigen/teichoic acid export membrane protein